ncbi:MAG: Lon protease [Fimbriimonadales bacterium]
MRVRDTSQQSSTRRRRSGEHDGVLSTLPVLPIRDAVHFPEELSTLLVGRERSLRALDRALKTDRLLLVVAQKDVTVDEPEPSDLYRVGVVSEAVQALPVPDGTMRVVLRGQRRAEIAEIVSSHPFALAAIKPIEVTETHSSEMEALMRECASLFERVAQMSKQVPAEAVTSVMYIERPGRLADAVAHHLPLKPALKQQVLEAADTRARLEVVIRLLLNELEVLQVQQDIRSRVEREMGDTQREYYLREQLRVIQQELNERDERGSEIEEYAERIARAKMPEEVAEHAEHEIRRLEKMPSAAPEGVVIRTYLDWLCGLPWAIETEDTVDIRAAARILDEDHYGLQNVKERIIEFLAVRQLTARQKGPILCFVGPPGVGKTSIGRSIARSMGRKFVRVSLGGVRDEAEIRGHRRTYIGAMPGRIIQGIKQCGTRNPVFMLDEIDKLGMDFRGDPTAALLEALDPEQNERFSDHYLEVPFDLSNVMFIMTANILDTVPPALQDRMETIRFPGYTEEEKLAIAKGFLLPQNLAEHGLTASKLKMDDAALRTVIRSYTREAGVRGLEREIARVCRKVARKIAEGTARSTTVRTKNLAEYLGRRRYRYGVAEAEDQVAAATGLVYTEFGGDIITIEVSFVPGEGKELLLTGQLGEVMKESAHAALTYVRSRVKDLGGNAELFRTHDLHIHVPAGAVPKDGPSAGITIAVALASAVTGRRVHRDMVMTGEITLRGKVLPVGGIKEKMLAAHRAGMSNVILPKDNDADLADLPEVVRETMHFHLVSSVDEALRLALV